CLSYLLSYLLIISTLLILYLSSLLNVCAIGVGDKDLTKLYISKLVVFQFIFSSFEEMFFENVTSFSFCFIGENSFFAILNKYFLTISLANIVNFSKTDP